MLKFRTMYVDADARMDETGVDRSAAFFKVGAGDPRVTRVGAALRAWSLDELPQLFNVVKGDMSFVGLARFQLSKWLQTRRCSAPGTR